MSAHAALQRKPPQAAPVQRAPALVPAAPTRAQILAEERQDYLHTRRILVMRAGFAAESESAHWIATRRLGSIPDETMARIQRDWARLQGQHLYPYLLHRLRQRPNQALRHAVMLLRQAYARNAPLRAEFSQVYAGATMVADLAAQFATNFAPEDRMQGKIENKRIIANEKDAEGLAALRDQPREVIRAIAAAFSARTGREAVAWLIAEVPRTPSMIRAVAILREGTDRTPHTDLACELIPPANRNNTDPVRLLRSLPLAQRKLIEERYKAVFTGIGPEPGATAPDTLRAHLRKTCGVRDVGAYHEALILLHHEPTDAERLYIALSRWEYTKNESAVAILQDCLRRGISQQRLIIDWMTQVKGGLGGTVERFSDDPPREHIRSVFGGIRSAVERKLLILFDQLPPDEAAPVSAEATPRLRMQLEDIEIQNIESRRLRAAQRLIAEAEGHVSSDDAQIIAQCTEIAEILRGRIARLAARRRAVADLPGLDDTDRTQLAQHYDEALGEAHDTSNRVRAGFTRQLISGRIAMSGKQALLARMTLADDYGPADDLWFAVKHQTLEKGVTVIDKVWSAGKIDEMLRGAAKPLEDKTGQVLRPAYRLGELRSIYGALDHRRIMALATPDVSDGLRGAARIRLEMTEGDSDTDIGRIADLMEHAETGLRRATVAAFVAWEAGPDAPAPASGQEKRFIALIHRHYIKELGEDLDAGTGANFQRLSRLVLPPRTATEHAAAAHRKRATGDRAALGGVTRVLADFADDVTGDHLRENVERAQDMLNFMAGATPEQLAELQALTGTKSPEELAAWQSKRFDERQTDRRAMETSCAQLVSNIVETAVEAGLGLLTGGVGWIAVANAMIASVISMTASEGLLGPDYKLMSTENLQALIASGLGTAMSEFDLRSAVVKRMPLSRVEAWAGGKGAYLAQGVQNVATGMIESGVTAGAEALVDIIVRDRLPSAEDITRHADMVIGRMLAKSFSTGVSVHHHPGRVNVQSALTQRLRNNIIFRLALKVTESGAKEIVTTLISGKADQTFAQKFFDLAWKEARGTVSTTVKTTATSIAAHLNARGERARIDRFRTAEPAAFAALLAHVTTEHFHGKDGAALQAQYLEMHSKPARAKAPLSVEEFMLDRLRQGDAAAVKLLVAIHKGMTAFMPFYDKGGPSLGVFAAGGPAPKDLGEIAREMGGPGAPPGSRGKPERFRGIDDLPTIFKSAIAMSARHAEADGTPNEALRTRVLALMREHLNAEPRHFAKRSGLIFDVLEGRSPMARGLLAGDAQAVDAFIRQHGSWKQAIEFLEVVAKNTPARPQQGEAEAPPAATALRVLMSRREALMSELHQGFHADLDPGASTTPTSDKDVSFGGHNASANLARATALMVSRYGPRWTEVLHTNFYTEGSNLTRYADVAHMMPRQQRDEVLRQLTHDTEVYAFAKMLKAAGSNFKLMKQVEALAEQVKVDLTVPRAVAASSRSNPAATLAALNADIDRAMFRFRELDEDKQPKVNGAARVQLAVDISRLQIEANFHTHEANIGPGANRSILQGVKNQGDEAYQAMLSHMVSLTEHQNDVGFERRYEPPKYILRIVGEATSAGVDEGHLDDVAKESQKTKAERNRLRKGPLREASPMAQRVGGPGTAGELVVERTRSIEALGPVLGRLKAGMEARAPGQGADTHVRAVPRLPTRMKTEAEMLVALGARQDPASGHLVAPAMHPGLTPDFLLRHLGLTAAAAEAWQVHYAAKAVDDPQYAAPAQLMREIADTLLNHPLTVQ